MSQSRRCGLAKHSRMQSSDTGETQGDTAGIGWEQSEGTALGDRQKPSLLEAVLFLFVVSRPLP